MDSSAINKIQESVTTDIANQALNEKELSKKAIALPSEFTIHDLEHLSGNRSRFRGSFKTNSIESFAEYTTKHKLDGASTFIDANSMSAKLFIDIGDANAPGHCDHTALVQLIKTSPYVALLNIVNQRLSQNQLVEFIEDFRSNLTASVDQDEDGEFHEISLVKALQSIRKIKIEEKSVSESKTNNFSGSNSTMDSFDVTSEEMPPAFFHFKCEPYHELSERTFDLRLTVIKHEKSLPLLTLRIVRFEEQQEEMARQFKEKIVEDLPQAIATYVGNFTA